MQPFIPTHIKWKLLDDEMILVPMHERQFNVHVGAMDVQLKVVLVHGLELSQDHVQPVELVQLIDDGWLVVEEIYVVRIR